MNNQNRVLRSAKRKDELLPPLEAVKRRKREQSAPVRGSRPEVRSNVRVPRSLLGECSGLVAPPSRVASESGRRERSPENVSVRVGTYRGTSERSWGENSISIEAARKRAEVQKRLAEERARIEMEYIDAQERADLGNYRAQSEATGSLYTRSAARMTDWLSDVQRHNAEDVDNRNFQYSEDEMRRFHNLRFGEPREPNERSATESGIAKLTEALTRTIESVGKERSSSKGSGKWLPEKEFMVFNGNPLEWHMFRRAFELSMKHRSYSEEENILRLFNCLKEDARDSVISLMTNASTVQEVMEVLEVRFGSPNVVAQSIAEEIRRLPPVDDRKNTLAVFATKIKNWVAAAEAANHKGILHNSELADLITRKMPPVLAPHYHRFLHERRNEDKAILIQLSEFLFSEANMASLGQSYCFSAADFPKHVDKRKPTFQKPKYRSNPDDVMTVEVDKAEESRPEKVRSCDYCLKEGHSTGFCTNLWKLPMNQRWSWVTSQKCCFQCLGKDHFRRDCKAPPCRKNGCNKFHHKMLHNDEKKTEVSKEKKKSTVTETEVEEVNNAFVNGKVLLKVLPVKIFGPKGFKEVNALLDEGSTVTLMNEELADELNLEGTVEEISIRGVMGTISTMKSRLVTLEIEGADHRRYTMKRVRTIPGFSAGSSTLRKHQLAGLAHLQDLDIATLDGAPKLLIGQDNWDLIITREIRAGKKNLPVASLTTLGWVVHGQFGGTSKSIEECNFILSIEASEEEKTEEERTEEDNLNELVKNSFTMDSLGITNYSRKPRLDKRAEEILTKTTKRVEEKWESGLLWKSDKVQLPDSYDVAMKRLLGIERKFKRDEKWKELYVKEITKLLEAGFAEKVLHPEKINKRTWYLPHFGVSNVNKPGRVRVVMDAASEVDGISLNNQLLSGPDLLQSLLGVLLNFRRGRIGFSGDIQDMFLRVGVIQEDQSSQRFLWREKVTDKKPSVYEMKSLIFGAASSPCTAIFVKNMNAKEYEEIYPKAVEAIVKKHYVDDYVDSVDSVEEGRSLVEQVTTIHKSGGFRIRKWISNDLEVLKGVPESEWNEKSAEGPIERVLGIKWNTASDDIIFDEKKINVSKKLQDVERRPSKREILRVVMSIYDPLGMLVPFTVQGRMLLQQVWRSGIDWDEKLEDQEFLKWRQWVESLPSIGSCSVPRCYFSKMGRRDVELHVFADASQEAYATVCYLRTTYEDGSVEVSFVMGKAKVAPVKPTSIPRLELQAALIASRLGGSVVQDLELKITRRYFWTDSRIVLCWIRNDARRYNTFVANRLGEIDERTELKEWKWVPTKENVADDATRWRQWPKENERWLQGPEVLLRPENEWPKLNDEIQDENLEEVDVSYLVSLVPSSSTEIFPEVSRFSSWLRLVRSAARTLQAAKYFSMKRSERLKIEKKLDLETIQKAENMLIIQCQEESFGQEIACLKKKIPLSRKSKLLQLSPVLDEQGVLRADGRIKKVVDVPEGMKRPIVLDERSKFTRLIIQQYHIKFGHGNTETVVNELRGKYLILGLRRAVKSVAVSCQRCRILKLQPEIPRIADLPSERLDHHVRPFTNCGIDYFGPMLIKVGRRHEKRWGVLFTCLTTRAIHLELAHSLTTDSAIMALRRMVARRGSVAVLWSDNGTNLRGADKELRRAIEELDEEALGTAALNKGINWKFNVPGAPHMGGSWERLIRNVKSSLKVILKERFPTEETLSTLLAEVENIVNSRPLTHVSSENFAEVSLTPNHFLIGENLHSPLGSFDDDDLNLKKQWRIAQRLADHFWKRWVKEYLPDLIPRKKWSEEKPNIEVGDVVLVVDPNLPRNVWPRGLVSEVILGGDGRARSAKIFLGRGQTMFRPVAKLVVIVKHKD